MFDYKLLLLLLLLLPLPIDVWLSNAAEILNPQNMTFIHTNTKERANVWEREKDRMRYKEGERANELVLNVKIL